MSRSEFPDDYRCRACNTTLRTVDGCGSAGYGWCAVCKAWVNPNYQKEK